MKTTIFTYDEEQLDVILTEIASYEVVLQEDPTLPNLGSRYLQKSIARCRNFMNRIQFYLQKIGSMEKNLRIQVKLAETDIEFKINELLADDPIVRQQPSISDRKALATSKLRQEHENLAEKKVKLINIQETLKLLKMKYYDLRQTNGDIKAQRQLVKDDIQAWGEGGPGYILPQGGSDGFVPDGMPPPVFAKIDPKDLLDPGKKPEDLPKPKDAIHAEQIASFFNSNLPGNPGKSIKLENDTPVIQPPISYDDLLST